MLNLSMSMLMDLTEIYIKGPQKGITDDQMFYHMITRYIRPDGESDEESGLLPSDTSDQKAYMKDGIIYTDDQGTRLKTVMEEEFDPEAVEALMEDFEKIKIEDYVTSALKNDGVVTLTLDAKKLALDALRIAVRIFDFEEMDEKELKRIMDGAEKLLKAAGIKTTTVYAVIENDNFRSITATLKAKADLQAIMAITMGDVMGEAEDEAEGETGSSGRSEFGYEYEMDSFLGIGKNDKDVLSLGTGDENMMDIDVLVDFTDIKVNEGAKIKYPDLKKFKTWEEIYE